MMIVVMMMVMIKSRRRKAHSALQQQQQQQDCSNETLQMMTNSIHKTTRERERENFLRKSCSSKTWETKHCNTEKTRVGIACLLANHITALYFTALHSNSFCKNFKTSSTNLRPHTTRNMSKKEDIDRAASTHARSHARFPQTLILVSARTEKDAQVRN